MGSNRPQNTRGTSAFASRECSIVEGYREHHREIFLESFLCFFVRHFHCTKDELEKLRTEVQARSRRLRQVPRKRGRPPGRSKLPTQKQIEVRGAVFDPHDCFRNICGIWADRDRLALREQGILFIGRATRDELAKIRRAVAARERQGWQTHPGHPRALQDDETHQRALRVVWMRYAERKRWKEIQERLIPAAFGDESYITVRRLQDYFAELIYRAVCHNSDWIIQTRPGQYKIKPGALDDKNAQLYLRFETGLPFNTDHKTCILIVENLWWRGFHVYWKRFEQNEGQKQNAE